MEQQKDQQSTNQKLQNQETQKFDVNKVSKAHGFM